MIIQAELKYKQSEYGGEACVVDKIIELPNQRFKQFSRALLADYDFIAESKNSIQRDTDSRHCLLILDAEGTDGFLVDPQGYNYARYSAFVPNARSLLTLDMVEIDRSYLTAIEPWPNRIRDEMLRLMLHTHNDQSCLLVLPADDGHLNDVKSRLGVNDFAEVEIRDVRFKVPYIGELMQTLDCPSVEEYNRFAVELENIWQRDGALLTYAAVLDAERPETLHEAHALLRNLHNYQRITDVYDYGQQRLLDALDLNDDALMELDGFMDFEKYGHICMENDGVVATEFGRLRRLEPPFPEQEQGMQMSQ